MDPIEQRLSNLRRLDMTDEMDLPTAPELMSRARVRRQRRRIAATIGGLAAAAAVIGAVVGIALRDDPDDVETIDNTPRTTVTLGSTTSTTAETTTSTTATTATSTTAARPVLRPPDSELPAAGTCGGSEGAVAEAEMFDDVPAPRCVQVLPHQKLRLTNRLSAPITVDLADFHTVIQPGQAYLFDRPCGEYLQLGVHRMTITHDLPDANSTGPEIFLVAELGQT